MWHEFGEAIATLAGALTGLLFVAVSIKSAVLAGSVSLSARAAQTLVLFMTSVIVSILLVAPQPAAALGPELIVTAVVSGAFLYFFDRQAGHDADNLVARYIEKASPNLLTSLLLVVGGATFMARAGGGLYWLIPAVVASLTGGVVNAWLFLVKLEAGTPKADAPRN